MNTCTGTSAVYTFGTYVYRYDQKVKFFDDTSLPPNFPGGREQESDVRAYGRLFMGHKFLGVGVLYTGSRAQGEWFRVLGLGCRV